MACAARAHALTVLVRILGYLRPYWVTVVVAYACLFVASLIDLYMPDLVRQVIDCGINRAASTRSSCPAATDPSAIVAWAAMLTIVLTIFKGALQWGQGFLGEYGAQCVAYDLRRLMYEHLQKLSFSWHDQAQTGQLMARATSDVEQLRNFSGRGFIMLVQIVLMCSAIGVVLFLTNWKLAIASMVMLPFVARTVTLYNRAIRPLYWQVQQELAVLATVVQENIAGARVVRAFAREPYEIQKFKTQNAVLQRQYLETTEISVFANPFMDVISQLGTVVVLWFGGYLIITGELSVGQLVAFNTYLLLLTRPIRRLGNLIGQASQAMAAGERIFEILDAPLDVDDTPGAPPLPTARGEVVFDHVWSSYVGSAPVLRDVTFRAEPGQTVAVLGATGSGKTSIVNLIPRFYDVSDGRVLIDGHDVRDVQLQSLRRQIGMVLQDTVLFSGTIRDNIAFGVPDATDEQVVAAARAARAHDFISEIPDGYATKVGERGITLSGGQKQRIAIARALLLDPRILILDDFTSAVDTETESLIRQALDVLMKGRTTFVIAQRVSTVQSADRIIVLDKGEIVGMGTHGELMETNSIYAEIYQLQLVDESVVSVLKQDRPIVPSVRPEAPTPSARSEALTLSVRPEALEGPPPTPVHREPVERPPILTGSPPEAGGQAGTPVPTEARATAADPVGPVLAGSAAHERGGRGQTES
ncbi:MAG: ATP-binding cassette, subfamily multidrug efflux pump [Chloroflexota bacterium]|nr:ATP-binding cassette, subfamily multidrug efflux pump [Chloroflexota bacterium]